MTIEEMENIEKLMRIFRKILERHDGEYAREFVIEIVTNAGGEFEEQCLIERFREEVLDFYKLAA